VEKLEKVRAHSKLLVSLGDCAVTANVPGMRNSFPVESVLKRGYIENATLNQQIPLQVIPRLLPRSLPLHEVVKVDLFVPGCPPHRDVIHFALSELITVDSREVELLLRTFPHYVPCAILALARYLEDFRREVDAPVFISANGGYRSPAHRINRGVSLHNWGTAADIYRVGDTYLDDEKSIARYAEIAASLGAEVRVRAYRDGDDHLQVDLGYLTIVPRECSES